jgi:transcriptional regulator with XRE-family HTH domain
MMTSSPSPYHVLLNHLTDQAMQLGMSYTDIAARSKVSIATVKRFFAGHGETAEFSNVCRIAAALGVTIGVTHTVAAEEMRHEAALKGAKNILAAIKATSALESQNISDVGEAVLQRKTLSEILTGSPRKLWK